MRGRIAVIGLLAGLLGSCGGLTGRASPPAWAATLPEGMAVEGDLTVRPEEREHPALELRFPWANARSSLGWGGVHLWARPAVDHVSVSAIVDAPAAASRWAACDEAILRIDGREVRVPARYVGRPMSDGQGHYDAVQLDLDVLQLRKIALGRELSGHICGDPFALAPGQRDTLGRFVRWFDAIAVPEQHGDAPYFREVGPDLRALPTEHDGDDELIAG